MDSHAMNGNGVAPAFSLAPGAGREAPASAPLAGDAPAPASGKKQKNNVMVMDYTLDFPSLPEQAADDGAAAGGGAWARPMPRIRSSNVSVVFHLPAEERAGGQSAVEGSRLSREQEHTQKIAQDCKCSIELSEAKDGTLTVMLSGKRECVDEARRRVVGGLQQQAQREISIPKDHHRWLIGKNGERLRELEAECDCRITMPGRDVASDIIRISGPRDAIERAAHRIIALSEQQAKMASAHLLIEREYWPWVRGPNNETLDALQKATGARINIPPPSASNQMIVVSGEKDGVAQAAARLRQIHAEKKASTKVITVEIPRAQHRYVIGVQGSGLADILRTTGVSVEVPPESADSDTITLRGEPTAFASALPAVYQKATSVITKELQCPAWLHRFLIGHKGAAIRAITGEHPKVQVDFEESGRIVMQGPPEELAPVEAALTTKVNDMKQNMDCKVVKVPPQHHRHIIGKSGASVNKMKNDYGVQISIPENTTNSDEIRIEGPKDGVAKAAAEIAQTASRIENERSRDMIIEQRFHRQLIGQGGAAVAEMRKKFAGVQFVFPEQGRKSDVVTIRGPKDSVDACFKHMSTIVKNMKEESYQERVPIFKDFHRVIIGKGGANIKRIRDETQCRIDLPDENSGDSAITVTGRQAQVQQAVKELQKIEAELAAIEVADVDVPQKLHSRMLGGGGRMIAEIANECGGVHIKFPEAKKGSDTVRVRGPKDDVARACQLLKDLAKDREMSSHEDQLKFKPELRRFLVGRNGATLRKVREAYPDVRIMVPRDGDTDQETIHLIGRQEDVTAAKKALAELVQTLNETVEITVDVEPSYHKHFVIRGAAVLREIQDDCGGCMISFPKQGSSDATVTIKGSKDGADEAKRRIEEVVDDLKNTVTEYVAIAQEHHRSLLTRSSSGIANVQREHRVRITFPSRDLAANGDETQTQPSSAHGGIAPVDAVAIVGRQGERMEAAKAALMALVPVVREVDVPFDLHRGLIGKGGAEIRQFQQVYDVALKIPPADAHSDTVTISGSPTAVAAAAEELASRVRQHHAESYEHRIRVPVEYHSRLIGPRGTQVEAYRKKYGVYVAVPRAVQGQDNNNVSDEIMIRGLEDKARECAKEIEDMIAELQSMQRQDCHIDPRIHSRIIGNRGKGLQKIMDDHNVDIRFPRSDEPQPELVVVSGHDMEQVLDAIDTLKNLEEEFMQDHVERTRYEAPTKPKQAAEPKQQGLLMKNAPWAMEADDFPSVGTQGAAANGQTPGGAWGRKR